MDEEQKLADELERDFDRSDAWEDVPGEDQARRSLGAQVTVRLDSRDAARLRRIARRRGVGYTSLLREWIEERVREEDSGRVVLARIRITAPPAAGPEGPMTGNGRWIREPSVQTYAMTS